MDILQAIAQRRSIAKVTQDAVSRSDIEAIIQAGAWAPTHKRTEPWRFVVFEGYGRQKLQQAMIDGTLSANAHLGKDEAQIKAENIAGKASRAPVVIAVWCAAGRGKLNPPLWEDVAAVSACLQNMSLAADALGLGSIWRSGALTEMPEVQALCSTDVDVFDSSKGDAILGFLYVGKPDENHPIPTRAQPTISDKIRWVTKA